MTGITTGFILNSIFAAMLPVASFYIHGAVFVLVGLYLLRGAPHLRDFCYPTEMPPPTRSEIRLD